MATKKKVKGKAKGTKRGPFTVLPRKEQPVTPREDVILASYRADVARLEEEIRKLNRAKIIVGQRHAYELAQASCPHRKPNMMPAYAGQFDHQDTLHLVCLYCQHNVHFSPAYVKDVKNRRMRAETSAAEFVQGSYGKIGGPHGSPVDPALVQVTYEELEKRAIAERKHAIETCGFDPEDLPVQAIASLLLAIMRAEKFMKEQETK
jgi:hypothetical protein